MLDFRTAGFFANCADAETDFLLFHVHLDDLELVLLTLFERQRLAVSIHRFRDVAEAFDSFGNFDEGAELRSPQNLAMNHIAHTMLREERLPHIGLKLLHAQREAASTRCVGEIGRAHV